MPPNKDLGDAFIKLGKIYKDQNNAKEANSYFKRAEKFYTDAIAYERENYVILKTNNEKDTKLIILENNKKIKALKVQNERFLKWLFLILSVLVLVVLLLLFKRYHAKQKSFTIKLKVVLTRHINPYYFN